MISSTRIVLAVTALVVAGLLVTPLGAAGATTTTQQQAQTNGFTVEATETVFANGSVVVTEHPEGYISLDAVGDQTFPTEYDATAEDSVTVAGTTPGAELRLDVLSDGDTVRFEINGEPATITTETQGVDENTTELPRDGQKREPLQLDVGEAALEGAATPAVADLDIATQGTNATVPEGTAGDITVNVTNTGDETADSTSFDTDLTIDADGTTVASETVTTETLAPGETDQITFTDPISELPTDEYTVTVADSNGVDQVTGSLSVTEPAPANFSVAINDTASTTNVTAEENATVVATIENTGDVEGTQPITFSVNGSEQDTTEETLTAGGTETVEFNYTTEAGDDGVDATVASDNTTATRTLNVDALPRFSVTINDDASTTSVAAGDDAIVNATIENTGDLEGTQTIDFNVNETTEQNDSVTLAGGATEDVEFSYPTELADDGATAEVASDDDTANRTLTVTPAPANFSVAINDTASTTNVTAGENATVIATIENTGDVEGTQSITFSVNGSEQDTTEVSNLTAGGTETVEFNYTTEAGDDGVDATVASDNTTASRTLNVDALAAFSVTINDDASATSVTAGENATVTATIENTGDLEATQTINFSVNGSEEDTTEVTLAGGATEDVEFSYLTALADDGVTAEVASDDDTANRTLSVAEPTPANFAVSDLQPQDTTVTAGETFTVSATIENTGDQTGTQDIELLTEPAADTSLDTETVTLDAGNSTTVSFESVSIDTVGTFNHTVASENESVTGTLTVEAQDDGDDPAEPDPQASVTFDNQTVPNGTEQVTVASANYTLGDGTPGDYVVVAHVVNDDGSISDPVGYSSAVTGEATDIPVDLNASEAQGDALDTLTETTTLRAMLHETSSDSAFGPSLGLATDDATITVEDPDVPAPAAANLTALDIGGQGDTARLTPGAERDVTVTLANTGDEAGTFDVTLDVAAGDVTETQTVDLDGGASQTVTFENVTGDLAAGDYSLTVTTTGSEATGSLTVKAAPAAIGGNDTDTASDLDGDGTFEDVNGDGELGVDDVFELFNNQDAIPDDDTAAFDFNNDGEFNVLDVQRLLNAQQEGN